jgi:hypothetical protein
MNLNLAGTFENPIEKDLPDFLAAVFDQLLKILWVLVPIVLIYAAITIVSSRGEPGKIQEAKKIIFWTFFVVALVVGGKELINTLSEAFKGLFEK